MVYELIGIVSSDSESKTSFENYLENFHELQSMVKTKQTARGGSASQGTPAHFSLPNLGDTSEESQDNQDPENTGDNNENEGENINPRKQHKPIPKTPLRKTAPPPPNHRMVESYCQQRFLE